MDGFGAVCLIGFAQSQRFNEVVIKVTNDGSPPVCGP